MSGSGLYYKLYNKCPIWLQNVSISLYGYKLYRQRYGKVYHEYIEELMNKDYSNLQSAEEYQNAELTKLVNYAVSNSPFYKEFYKGIDISKIKTVDDLKLLPILEKETLRQNIEQIYTIKPEDGIKSFTGGTTGKSLMVVYTRDDFQKRMAYLDAFKERLGVRNGMRRAIFSGRQFIPPNQNSKVFWRYNYILKQKLYSTFNLMNKNLPYYVEDLNIFKPEIINGFVSAIYDIAKYIKTNNISLTFNPIAIFTTSETLLPFHREMIEEAFGCPVYNQYASAEGAPFVTECKNRELHYNLDTGIIEIVNDVEMLITSFNSYGTPLIRYRIGDSIIFKDGKCTCGCCHPLVKEIQGRQVDYLISREKGKVSLSHLADVIKGLPNCIRNMQFIQNNLDEIDIKIVVDENRYRVEYGELIIDEMVYRFGKKMKFNLIMVDEIPREKSGKYSLIKNNIK